MLSQSPCLDPDSADVAPTLGISDRLWLFFSLRSLASRRVADVAMKPWWRRTYLYKPLHYFFPVLPRKASPSDQEISETLLPMDKTAVLENFPSGLETGNSNIRHRRQPQKWWKFGGRDVAYVSVDDGLDQKSSETSSLSNQSDTGKNVNNVFESPEALEIYKPVAGFEGTHRFDVKATWSPQEEKTLVRRVCSINSTDNSAWLIRVAA